MRQFALSTVCMIAALSTVPVMAAPAGKPGEPRRTGDTECTYTSPAKARSGRPAARPNGPRAKEVDCMVVKGYPSQDGRAALRRSLRDEAKHNLSTVVRPSLKDLLGKKPTS